ncbi:nucleotidyltransferase domain-containing protein [Clostridium aciditolerans]|uniref:Nucleotidyltransferase domain-containing protein n=1 Tax=Clostridium aciditolerans TaxID=339861 RepID=A0A934HSX0_9CLOT|nr:nucleotidyltransferase domain-containing protein [Clostridium aciditolerans]MBI6872703.1 nucleotidyltransferase domain-containing protein [Clostridium aciditolerans]
MKLNQLINNLKSVKGIVAVSQFGSYGSDLWIKDRSDIDLAVIVAPDISFMNTLDMEDDLLILFKDYYEYDNIHITFIFFNDFSSKYARIAVDSKNIYVLDEMLWFDFQHYVLKFVRNNEGLEKRLKLDEQFTYFGGIIDESLL